MTYENLWAPWREEYVKKADNLKECFLCHYLTLKDGVKNLILYRGANSFIILNRYPYNNGHLMIAPIRHVGKLEELKEKELIELFSLIPKIILVLKKTYHPHGFNLGMNLGRCAGAGIKDHLHVHIVPRWEGDTNYMTVLSGTKVIPEALEESYKKIKEVVQRDWKDK